MTVAWIAVVLIAVGLPLLAWWVGGRGFWGRLRPGAEPDVYRELVRRHGLGPAEAAEVEGAVTWGRELTDPRLRAAVVDRARTLRRTTMSGMSARRRVALAVFFLWGLLLVIGALAALVRALLEGAWGAALYRGAWVAALLAPAWWAWWAPRRALIRNSGPPSAT